MPVIKVKCKEVKIKVPITTLRIEPTTQTKTVEPSIEEQTITPDEGIFALSSVTVNPVTSEIDKSIKAENIKEGVSILGIEGTVKPFKELVLQDKTVNPTTEIQEIVADEGYDALNKVVVNAQTGVDIYDYFEKNIENTTNISRSLPEYIKKVPSIDTSKTTNFSYFFSQFSSITEIPFIDTSNGTNFNSMFVNCKSLVTIPELNTHNVNTAEYMFQNCNELISIPQLDTSNTRNIGNMFQGCKKLTTIPLLNASKMTAINYSFAYCSNLTNFGGLENIGEAYSTTQSANYTYYSLILSESRKLTHESLLNVINNLYDIKTKGCNAQKLVLGTSNLAKLTAEEIAIATEKGWTVS